MARRVMRDAVCVPIALPRSRHALWGSFEIFREFGFVLPNSPAFIGSYSYRPAA